MLGNTVRALREPLKTDPSAALRSGRALRRLPTAWHSPWPSRQARGT